MVRCVWRPARRLSAGQEIADGKGATIRITFRDARKGVRELDLTDEEAEKLGGRQCRTTCKPYFLNSERNRRNPFHDAPPLLPTACNGRLERPLCSH